MPKIEDEISEMLTSLNNTATEPEPMPDAEPIPEPTPIESKPDAELTPAPEPEPKAEEPPPEPTPEPEPAPEPSAETPPPEPVPQLDERDKLIEELRAKLAEKEKPVEPAKAPTTEAPISEKDFVGQTDLDDLTRDPKELNKAFNKIYQQAVRDTRSELLRTLPDVVKSNIAIMTTLREATERFYDENKDLKPFKKVVAAVFEELAPTKPNSTYGDIVKDVAIESRKRLGLPEPKPQDSQQPKKSTPTLPQKGGRAGRMTEKQHVDPLRSELDDMIKVIGR